MRAPVDMSGWTSDQLEEAINDVGPRYNDARLELRDLERERMRRRLDQPDRVRAALEALCNTWSDRSGALQLARDILDEDIRALVLAGSVNSVRAFPWGLRFAYISLTLTPPAIVDLDQWQRGIAKLIDRWSACIPYPGQVSFGVMDDAMLPDGEVRLVWDRVNDGTLVWVDQVDGPNIRFRGPDLASGLAYLSRHHPYSHDRTHCI